MIWWAWVLLGLALLAGELLTPGGFFLAFFGVSALLVGILAYLGLLPSPAVQWLLFSVASVVAVLLLRRPLLKWLQPRLAGRRVNELENETAIARDEIAPGAVGRAELRGSSWEARNVSDAPLHPGQRCRVQRIDGLQLHLLAE